MAETTRSHRASAAGSRAAGRPLRAVRLAAMLTLRELALVSGVAPGMIWAIEAGRSTPGAEDVRRICVALSVNPLDVAEFRRSIHVHAEASEPDSPRSTGPSRSVGL